MTVHANLMGKERLFEEQIVITFNHLLPFMGNFILFKITSYMIASDSLMSLNKKKMSEERGC